MLEKLLGMIRSGGTYDINTLATQLETTPRMVKVMLNHLQLIGVIQPYQACAESCNGCYFRNTCEPDCRDHPHGAEMPLYVVMHTTGNHIE